MTTRISLEHLTDDQKSELFTHLMDIDKIRVDGINGLMMVLFTHPDWTLALGELFNAWTADNNVVGQKSDAEIQRITAGAPPAGKLN